MAYIAYAAAWIATAGAVGFAIHVTHEASPLWAMLIPALISIQRSKSRSEEKKESDD